MDEKELLELLEKYRDLKVELGFYEEQMKDHQKKIKTWARQHVQDTGEIGILLKVEGARIKAAKPYTSTVVDQAKVKEMAKNNKAFAKKYLKERKVGASIKIEVD